MEGTDLQGVFTLKEFQDGISIKGFVENSRPKKGVIIGGGYIGVEMAESFRHAGMEVTVVEALPRIMAIMDEDLGGIVADELVRNKVNVITGKKVVALKGGSDVQGVTLEDGTSIDADCVLLSIGVAPNSNIAEEAGLTLGRRKAILVDRYLRTSDPGIYAAGDCATVYHRLLCDNVYIPLGLTANRQGKMCGENIIRDISNNTLIPFPGVIGTAVTKVFGLEVAKTGIGQAEIEQNLLRHISSAKIKAKTLPGYFPGSSEMWVKIFFEEHTGLIKGGQIVGGPGSGLRINTIVAAISSSMRLDELYALDAAYAPPFSPVWDPLLIAAREGMRRRV